MSQHPVDVVSQIKADHRAVEALLADLGQGHGDPREVLRVIVRELSLHAGVEELVVYPVVRDIGPDGDGLIDTDLQQHQALKEVLARLDGADLESASTDRDIDEVTRLVELHVAHEEGETLPLLGRTLDADALAQLGSRFLEAKKTAPTHPHPHAPNRPPLNAMADKAAAVVDRARDAVHRLTSH